MELTLASIAEVIEGEIRGDANVTISGAASFEDAKANEITFAGQSKFLKRIDETGAGAIIVPKDFDAGSRIVIRVHNPQLAFIKVLNLFHPSVKPSSGISPNAHIGKTFFCGQDISIAPYAVVGDNVTLGHRVVIHSSVVIGDNVVIGDDVLIYPNVTILERCIIGDRVIIQAGTVIGSDGFGFVPDGNHYYKIPHLGIVKIDNDVEIGAQNAIDRATFGKTWIQSGVKTDNLVHIAHNVTVGENTLLVGQVGISGSVTIGKNAILAGQAGISGHLTIGNHAVIGPQAGVAKSVPDGETVSGSSAIPHRQWLRVQRVLPKLPELARKLSEMERRLEEVEEKQNERNKRKKDG
jgi:UDP-3-O-[3-hydroxymyristoyl] glucosamine N-acyltransferase